MAPQAGAESKRGFTKASVVLSFLQGYVAFSWAHPSFFWIRAYHDKFGVHLAQLKKEMGKPSWKVGICVFSAAWFP
jgi:hypothetical protein